MKCTVMTSRLLLLALLLTVAAADMTRGLGGEDKVDKEGQHGSFQRKGLRPQQQGQQHPQQQQHQHSPRVVDHEEEEKERKYREVVTEFGGIAGDVLTFFELEGETNKSCGVTPGCAWQLSFVPTDVTAIAPEPHVIYHYSLFTMFENDPTVYRVRGRFPRVRYFSIQTYTLQRQPIDGLADYQIKPLTGVNPYSDLSASPDNAGTYEVYITANGNHGYPNELKAYHADRLLTALSGRNCSYNIFLLALRFYASDPSNDQNIPWGTGPTLFGFAPPPTVEVKTDKMPDFKPLPQCTPEQEHCNQVLLTDVLSNPQFLLWALRDVPGLTCPLSQPSSSQYKDKKKTGKEVAATQPPALNSDFYLYTARLPALLDFYIGYKNVDVTYLYYCESGRRLGKNFVLKITGTLASTPHGLYDEPRIARHNAYDARYVSFHAVDLRPPIPSYSAVYDGELWAQHGPGWDRRYSIVVARDQSIAEKCGLFNEGDTMLPFRRFDGRLDDRELGTPAIIYREILPSVTRDNRPNKSPTDVAIQCGERGATGVADTTSPAADITTLIMGTTDRARHPPQCEDTRFYRRIMQERYPEVVVYHCDPDTGVASLVSP